jgi:hypothetical protein
LTSAEQLERRRKGLCFNCDEPYTPGHTCAHLFYLETVDDAEVETLIAELDATTLSEAGITTYGPVDATAFVVSLHAMASIKTAKTMLLPVMIHGERLTALVDTGSTHNFLLRDAMRRLALQPAGAEKFSITIANGDRLACQGVARQVPVLIGDEPFSIDCVGIDLGCYDFILGVDFLSILGPILWDLDMLSLIFWREGGRRVQWTGIGGSGAVTPQLQLMATALDEAHPLLADHLQHVAIIFNELRAHRLHLKRSKFLFGTTSVAYLGHVISAEGGTMDADKVAAVAAWPTPQSPRALRGFLGLAGYYRKYIRDFGLIAAPLTRPL